MKVRTDYFLPVLAALILIGCETATLPTAVEENVGVTADARSGGDVYIVVLKDEYAPGARAANQARAAEVARGLGLSPVHSYGSAIFGFAAAVSEGRLNAIERDPRVAYVEKDAPVWLPNPRAEAKPPWPAEAAARQARCSRGGWTESMQS